MKKLLAVSLLMVSGLVLAVGKQPLKYLVFQMENVEPCVYPKTFDPRTKNGKRNIEWTLGQANTKKHPYQKN